MTLRVLLADDHNIMRAGLRSLLESQSDIAVVGEAENGRTAVKLTRKLIPDIVIMDVSMPDLNGIDATRQILDELDRTRVIALSMHSDRRYIEGMLRAGVSGYLIKDCVLQEMVDAVRVVANGQIYLSPRIAGTVVQSFVNHLNGKQPASSGTELLTLREREVLQLIAEGVETKQIADRLNISPKTVESHRRNLMEKLHLYSIAELTKYAIREGLTELDG